MARFTLREQRRNLAQFFRAEIKNLDSATEVVVKNSARLLRRKTLVELRRFRRSRYGNGGFQKAAKVYDVKAKGTLGPASYMRLGPEFIGIFQEGGTVEGRPNLSILLPSGEALGYRRITPGNTWNAVYARLQRDSDGGVRIQRNGDQTLVLIQKRNRWIGVYLFKPQVTVPKKLSVYETAEEIANDMPKEIVRLMENGE